MTTDLKDVLKELDSKIAEVYDLDLAEEMSDIYIDLWDRYDESSKKYWKLVKALAKTEKERDDLVRKLDATVQEEREEFYKKFKEEENRSKFLMKSFIEKDQAEYDRDYYKNEVEWLRNEVEWHRREARKERRLRVAAEYEKELAEMELLGQEVRYDLDD